MKTWVFRPVFFNPVAFRERITAPCTNRRMNKFRTLVPISAKHWRRCWLHAETEKKSRRFLRFTIWANIACRIDWMHHWELIVFFHGKSVVYCVLVLSLHLQNINRESSAWTSQLATGSWDWSLKTARKSRSRTKPPRKTWNSNQNISGVCTLWGFCFFLTVTLDHGRST